MPVLLNSGYQHRNNTTFNANCRSVTDKYGQIAYKTTTYFFRDDMDWYFLMDYLCRKYINTDKVNVINHACSNGMEPLSFVMGMIANYPKSAGKFFPVIARDINYDNIYSAQKGKCGASMRDVERIDYYTNNMFKDFLIPSRPENKENFVALSPKPIISEKIIFSQGDIFDDIKTMPNKNTVLFCRNLWMYLPEEKQEILAKTLGEKFDKTCTVAVGSYDSMEGKAHQLLTKYGFFPQDGFGDWSCVYSK